MPHTRDLQTGRWQACRSSRGRLARAQYPANIRCMASSASSETAELIEQKNQENDVVIYSKSYCPFSVQIKQLFKKLQVEYKAFELDEIVEGDDILDSLMDKTASRTVPQVFIKGEYIGGCDEAMQKYNSGKLKQIFESAGVPASF
ncbi:hypothetical protein WJX73_009401 [Symbiochloris irregularis]|uniref:Glutaredoxin domain-containing protein n=1 Tax=Symbiochloris irregularis TaxID=706552 RepID=A0AAW1PMJ7_9CHLO